MLFALLVSCEIFAGFPGLIEIWGRLKNFIFSNFENGEQIV